MSYQTKKEEFMDMYDDSIHSGCELFMYQTEEKINDIYLPFVDCHIISRDDMRRRNL